MGSQCFNWLLPRIVLKNSLGVTPLIVGHIGYISSRLNLQRSRNSSFGSFWQKDSLVFLVEWLYKNFPLSAFNMIFAGGSLGHFSLQFTCSFKKVFMSSLSKEILNLQDSSIRLFDAVKVILLTRSLKFFVRISQFYFSKCCVI